MIEVDWWTMTDREGGGLRTYIQKGGFVIVDDFKAARRSRRRAAGTTVRGEHEARAAGRAFVDMAASHPIFHAFFEINDLDIIPQAYNAGRPVFRGLFEDNDPNKRLQMIVNYNTDISQFWEWSGRGFGRSTTRTKPTSSA